MSKNFTKDIQYYKFCFYGFLKNLRFFEPFLILFFREKGLSFLQIGTLYAIREISVNILEIPSGLIADAFGRRRSLILSFLFYIISFIIFFTFGKYSFFILGMLFYAIGDAFRTGAHKAMIFEYLKLQGWKDQRAHYYGHTRSWSQIGSAVSALLAASIVLYTGSYQSVFIFSTIPYFLDLLLIASYPKQLEGENISISVNQIKSNMIRTGKDFLFSFKNKSILKAIGNLSVHSGFHQAVKDYLQPVIQTFALSIPVMLAFTDKQKSAILVGILYFIIYLLTAFSARSAGKVKDKLKSIEFALNLTMYSGFVLAFISGLFYHYSFYFLSIIFYVGIYLIENLRNPIGVSYVSELYKNEILATALSANSQAKSLFAAILAPILGLLADQFGIGIALSLLAILLMLISTLFRVRKEI